MSEHEDSIKAWKASVQETAWYGVDLDATLAVHGVWKGPMHVGDPVPAMVRRVRRWLKQGRRVKVFTARVCEPDINTRTMVVAAIQEWCLEHVGTVLEVTNVKDYSMIELWDDRARRVVPNTGRRCCRR